MPTFLVTLATGRQGTGTVCQLVHAGHNVHALVRGQSTPAALALKQFGATLYEGTLNDISTLRDAVSGTEGIFLNLVPDSQDPNAELRATQNVLQAAREAATVTTIVLSTAIYAGRRPEFNYHCSSYYSSKLLSEQAVLSSGFPRVTILRPGWLMHSNIAPSSAVHWPELLPERTLVTASKPETRIPYLDPEDVGKFAAAALLSIELGSENLTTEEAAEIMSRVAGVEVKIEETNSKVPKQRFNLLANGGDFQVAPGSLDEYGNSAESDPLKRALGL
ncbi:NAD dependent epimerase/dehydratase [Xylogone sp. PMI_703]|nr:NAD dependent epimerase/dehydratase [Xylogone sp. PMI_703]